MHLTSFQKKSMPEVQFSLASKWHFGLGYHHIRFRKLSKPAASKQTTDQNPIIEFNLRTLENKSNVIHIKHSFCTSTRSGRTKDNITHVPVVNFIQQSILLIRWKEQITFPYRIVIKFSLYKVTMQEKNTSCIDCISEQKLT